MHSSRAPDQASAGETAGIAKPSPRLAGHAPVTRLDNSEGSPEQYAFDGFAKARRRAGMKDDVSKLDELQSAYKTAVEKWIAAIREEEALASVNHSVTDIDKWEAAHFREDEIRSEVKAAKTAYEDALREKFFGF
jgi:hypothetical protein